MKNKSKDNILKRDYFKVKIIANEGEITKLKKGSKWRIATKAIIIKNSLVLCYSWIIFLVRWFFGETKLDQVSLTASCFTYDKGICKVVLETFKSRWQFEATPKFGVFWFISLLSYCLPTWRQKQFFIIQLVIWLSKCSSPIRVANLLLTLEFEAMILFIENIEGRKIQGAAASMWKHTYIFTRTSHLVVTNSEWAFTFTFELKILW